MKILKYKKIFFAFSGVLIALSLFSVFYYGLNLGIDFTGGSVLEFKTEESIEDLRSDLEKQNLENFSLRTSEEGYILRTKTLTEENKNELISNLSLGVELERFSTVGPTLGQELKTKALISLAIVVLIVIFFIAYAFRKVSTPVSSWKYGFATIIALFHDIIITVGVFTWLGYFYGLEISSLFITALLVILGYSINDTIVVFDRVRDNLNDLKENRREKEFEEVLNKSFRQTIIRSINTSLTTLVALIVLYFAGIESIKDFTLALIIGIISGTYSSIFLAIPLLSVFNRPDKKKLKKRLDN